MPIEINLVQSNVQIAKLENGGHLLRFEDPATGIVVQTAFTEDAWKSLGQAITAPDIVLATPAMARSLKLVKN